MTRHDEPGGHGEADDSVSRDPGTAQAAPPRTPRQARHSERDEDPRHRPGRRKVHIVRRIQLWSVFKIALLGSLVLYAICLISVALLWSVSMSTGQIHHIEKFMRDIGFRNWTFDGPVLFQAVTFLGAVGMIVTSVMLTLWAAIVNVVSELTGGIRFIVIETDEVDEPENDSRRPNRRARRGVK